MRDDVPLKNGSRSTTSNRSHGPVIVLTGTLTAFLIGATIYSTRVWGELGDTAMSSSGYAALIIGVIAATAVGSGLMGLVFYSSRSGIDDEVGADSLDASTRADRN